MTLSPFDSARSIQTGQAAVQMAYMHTSIWQASCKLYPSASLLTDDFKPWRHAVIELPCRAPRRTWRSVHRLYDCLSAYPPLLTHLASESELLIGASFYQSARQDGWNASPFLLSSKAPASERGGLGSGRVSHRQRRFATRHEAARARQQPLMEADGGRWRQMEVGITQGKLPRTAMGIICRRLWRHPCGQASQGGKRRHM